MDKKLRLRAFLKNSFKIIIGLLIVSFGNALLYTADMGSTPISTLSEGLSKNFKISVGNANLYLNLFLLLVVFIFDRKLIKYGTVYCVVLIGLFIDVWMPILENLIVSSNFVSRIIACLVGVVILAFGLSYYVGINGGLGPVEGVAQIIFEKSSFDYKISRILFDGSILILGIITGGTVGVGTIINVLLLGSLMQYFMLE